MNEVIKKNGITGGILLGVISVLITTLVYAFDMELFASFKLMGVLIVINIVFYCVLLSKTKKQLNNEFTFKQAFTTFFITAVISMAISTVYNFLLFNVIDPAAKETLRDITIKASREMMERFGAPEAEVEKALNDLRETDNYSIVSLIKGYFIGLAINSIFGLILALIFKSRKPAYRE